MAIAHRMNTKYVRLVIGCAATCALRTVVWRVDRRCPPRRHRTSAASSRVVAPCRLTLCSPPPPPAAGLLLPALVLRPRREQVTAEQRKAAAGHKELGNKLFVVGKFDEAAKHFSDAIAEDPTDHIFYSNRSACYASVGKLSAAVEDAEKCIELKPDWGKGRDTIRRKKMMARATERITSRQSSVHPRVGDRSPTRVWRRR